MTDSSEEAEENKIRSREVLEVLNDLLDHFEFAEAAESGQTSDAIDRELKDRHDQLVSSKNSPSEFVFLDDKNETDQNVTRTKRKLDSVEQESAEICNASNVKVPKLDEIVDRSADEEIV